MKITTTDINVTLNNNHILKGVTSILEKNEFVGLVGPNGSGKSTFLKTIYRTLKPNSGIITFNNKELSKISLKESAKIMGVLSQFNDFNFDLTVKELVMMGRSPHKKSMELDTQKDYEIAYSMLKKVNMESYINRDFFTLSGGERQRIMLARALTQEPKVLILDEPTNHLDIKYQLEILDLVKSLNLQVFAAIHDLNLAALYCDRIYMMKNGKIVAQGKPKEVLTKQLIKDVFQVNAEIFEHPNTKQLNIIYFSNNTKISQK